MLHDTAFTAKSAQISLFLAQFSPSFSWYVCLHHTSLRACSWSYSLFLVNRASVKAPLTDLADIQTILMQKLKIENRSTRVYRGR